MKTILVTCSRCKGSGWRDCSHCGGSGRVRNHPSRAAGVGQAEHDCPICKGLGQRPCAGCGGKGVRHRDIIDLQALRAGLHRQVARLRTQSSSYHAVAPPAAASAPQPSSAGTRIEIRHTAPPTSEQLDLLGCIISAVLFLLICILLVFGFDRVLVAGEAFFLFGAWTGMRAGDFFRVQTAERLESFRQYMVICFGLCSGLLAAYLILTTPEGQAITEWVTAQTLRIIGSLFASILGLCFLELAWRKIVSWIGG